MEPESSLSHLQEPTTCPFLETDQSSPCPHPTSWGSLLILSPHLCLGHPSGLFPWGFTTKSLEAPLLSFTQATCHIHLISSWSDHPNKIWWWVNTTKHLVMLSYPFPLCLVPLRPKSSSAPYSWTLSAYIPHSM